MVRQVSGGGSVSWGGRCRKVDPTAWGRGAGGAPGLWLSETAPSPASGPGRIAAPRTPGGRKETLQLWSFTSWKIEELTVTYSLYVLTDLPCVILLAEEAGCLVSSSWPAEGAHWSKGALHPPSQSPWCLKTKYQPGHTPVLISLIHYHKLVYLSKVKIILYKKPNSSHNGWEMMPKYCGYKRCHLAQWPSWCGAVVARSHRFMLSTNRESVSADNHDIGPHFHSIQWLIQMEIESTWTNISMMRTTKSDRNHLFKFC